MHVKICGIRTLNQARIAVKYGAFAIGFNFYKNSHRFITTEKAKKIITSLGSDIIKVGIIIDDNPNDLQSMLDDIGLDYIQIYHPLNNSPLKEKLILSLQIDDIQDIPHENDLTGYAYILLDAPKLKKDVYGGTGIQANSEVACTLAKRGNLILAGGLTDKNVAKAIRNIQPFAVDVASGIENNQQIICQNKVKKFIEASYHV